MRDLGLELPPEPVALVCGGAGAVGAAISMRLALGGHRVAVHASSQRDPAEKLVNNMAYGPHACVLGDLTDRQAAEGCINEAVRLLGKPPLVVVNAAAVSLPSQGILETSRERMEQHLDTMRIHHNIFCAVVPAMREYGVGRIVSITGALASRPFAGLAMQAATRAAIDVEAQSLALEVGVYGITVNTVAPGHVRVPQGAHSTFRDAAYAELDAISTRRRALRNFSTADDVADVVAFLVSNQARAVTGQVLKLAAGEPV